MKLLDLHEYLSALPYPGRGVLLGRAPDGERSVAAYFIMGRSENSRNRVFETTEDGIRTRAFDPSKMTDPSLIIYHPVRAFGRSLIVTTGDQTDTVLSFLERGLPMEEALRTRQFEPDSPNWTPRVSGLLTGDGSYKLSILKAADDAGTACLRQTFEYPPLAGEGHLIHTYQGKQSPLPSFEGEPRPVALTEDSPRALADLIWSALDPDNRVSLYVAFLSPDGKPDSVIINARG